MSSSVFTIQSEHKNMQSELFYLFLMENMSYPVDLHMLFTSQTLEQILSTTHSFSYVDYFLRDYKIQSILYVNTKLFLSFMP